MSTPIMKENEFSPVGKVLVSVGVVALAAVTIVNIARGDPQHPYALGIALVGFVFFFVAKLSVVSHKRWISFGPALMSPGMADAYRFGDWLMIVGVMATFL